MTDYHDREQLAALADRIDRWLASIAAGTPAIVAIERATAPSESVSSAKSRRIASSASSYSSRRL